MGLAAAVHGARWIAAGIPIELRVDRHKTPSGVIAVRDTLLDDEVIRPGGRGGVQFALTSVERTAFDLARKGGSRIQAIERLDALCRAATFTVDDVLAVADEHPRVRGRRRVPELLDLVDSGAQSPKESWLRMVLIEAGFPRPRTQIPVPRPNGYSRYYLDMGWEELMVAVEYDGEQHRTDSGQFRSDVLRAEYLDGLGWRRIRVLAGDRRADIVRRVERAGVRRTV